MRNVVYGIFMMLMLLGCVTQPAEERLDEKELEAELDNVTTVPDEDLISLSGDENLSVVSISASQVGKRWQFPLGNHTDEFIEVGIHSDAFIMLNNTHLMFLEDDEAVWLTPMIKDGNQTVLFNAVYSKEVVDCGADSLSILGKQYDAEGFTDGESFELDDKWKVGLEKEDGCLERVVIYLDGYFYDLEEDEQVSLFRNDNTILFGFRGMDENPEVRIVATRPA
jgi:hypothetical protein